MQLLMCFDISKRERQQIALLRFMHDKYLRKNRIFYRAFRIFKYSLHICTYARYFYLIHYSIFYNYVELDENL